MDYNNRKVLFIMTKMNSMENEVISALKHAGAEVDFCDDPTNFMYEDEDTKTRYWSEKLPKLGTYDILIWIDGYSFSKTVIDYLTKKNPDIYRVLYLWDDTDYFDWSYEFEYFDRVYSFDENDCRKYDLEYLPLYWCSYSGLSKEKKYDLSYIGAFTEDRVALIDKLSPYLSHYRTRINLVRPINTSMKGKAIRLAKHILGKEKNIKRDYILSTGVDKEEFDRVTAASRCVLDIVKLTQTGFTNRSMQTVGNGIKLITTNRSIKEAPFYEPQMIYIIDRNNIKPEEILEFIDKPTVEKTNDYVAQFEINNWIYRLIR